MQKFCVLALGLVLLAGCTSSPTMAEEPAANNATTPAAGTPEATAPEAAPKDETVKMPEEGAAEPAPAPIPAALTGEFKVIGNESIIAAITQREGELTDADKKDKKFNTLREAYANAGMMISANGAFVLSEPQNLKASLRKEGTLSIEGNKVILKVAKVDGKDKAETMTGTLLPDGHIVLTLGGIETELTNHNH
ncbi:hypothetical protein CCB81_07790 [Armatimonadetes bacterium Uphvl-Ar2]|nr:hypothetical protein CCB81_07790 [Armatimonadetes bacterium Uphvl-Ar2]